MNQLIYKGDSAELHNMKRRPNGLYRLESIKIDFTSLSPVFLFKNENNDKVRMTFEATEHYVKSVITMPRPTKAKLC